LSAFEKLKLVKIALIKVKLSKKKLVINRFIKKSENLIKTISRYKEGIAILSFDATKLIYGYLLCFA